ncbi:phosphate transport system substrate-binding protein [Novimethylophilus kurashikiensis]|uniref:Phosphate-binding protein PstS n=1 Tax=Novimethylophilus kurashikiensis TaxID=1825523 RepID=A0A2R5F9B6_9PROT|nr:phosphate ABC transporter substrate-binding protein PstS [Novimethylophilus kurashikiensis]GBG13224.1 phosphate transport system substrate-binding protein [Novimethylophilus kurashikiensis]
MRTIVRTLTGAVAAVGLAFAATAQAVDITGAGATFPYPIYAKWAEAYNAKTGVKLNYQSIGSGGGIKQIQNKTVNFGASDKPLTEAELNKDGLMQFPAVVGGVVPVINVEGVASGKLRLSGEVLANIFLKKITKWDDAAIKALNPNLALPSANITVVHRSDGSGTTFNFANYLTKVSEEWKTKVGADTSVSWPAGVGGKGNEGVASYVQRIKGSIGYVEYAYAKQNGLNYVIMQNKEGEFVKPGLSSFQAAAKYAEWEKAPGFYEIITNEPGKESWPIAAATFILMHKVQDNPAAAKEVLKFFNYGFTDGDKMAENLDYVPLPDSAVKLIQKHWSTNIKGKDGSAVWQ